MENTQHANDNNLPEEVDLSKCTPAMRAYFEAKAEFIKNMEQCSMNRITGE